MDGTDVGRLSVHVITFKEEVKDTVIWTKKGFQVMFIIT